ncbi:MAG TPA: hypothetical protein VF083_11930, partial [Acidimicrobiia bacterium]
MTRWSSSEPTPPDRDTPSTYHEGAMDIAIIGAGYVGLVTGGGLASLGHRVRLGESNTERVELLRSGGVP